MKNKWIILASLIFLFLVATSIKVMAAGATDELAKILEAGLDGLRAYFDWLIDILKIVW